MTWLRALWCRWRHTAHHRLTAGHREIYLRCDECRLRSPGIPVGERNYRSQLPGTPHVRRLGPKVVPFPAPRKEPRVS